MDINKNTVNGINSPTLLIIANNHFLINKLIEKLNNSSICVVVVCDKKNISEKYKSTKNIYFTYSIKKVKDNFKNIDYLIYFKDIKTSNPRNGNNFFKKLIKDFNVFNEINFLYHSKSTFVIHGLLEEKILEKIKRNVENIFSDIKKEGSLVLYGDLISLKKQKVTLGALYNNILKIASEKIIYINKNDNYYPLLIDEYIKYLYKVVFSLKSYGKTTFITGRPIKSEKIFKKPLNEKLIKKIDKKKRILLPYDEIIISKKLSKNSVIATYESLKKEVSTNHPNKYKLLLSRIPELNLHRHFIKKITGIISNLKDFIVHHKIKSAFISISVLFILPPLVIIFIIFMQLSSKLFYQYNFLKLTQYSVKTSAVFSNINYNYSSYLGGVPLTGEYFKIFIEPSFLLKLGSYSQGLGLKIIENYIEIFDNVYWNKDFDNRTQSKEIIFELDKLYHSLGIIQSEQDENKNNEINYLNYFSNDFDIISVRENILLIKDITDKIPDILGADNPKKYFIAYQDNSNLRPGGGVIESFSIIELSGSRVINSSIEDVSRIDENLSGEVVVPGALKKYFEVDRWFFKDSNWDPDFPSTALQMEFFIKNSINTLPDGIIALNQNLLFKILNVLDKNNTNKKIENYSEEKKKDTDQELSKESALTKLLKNILNKKYRIDKRKMLAIIKDIYSGFNDKDIQIFLKNNKLQENLKSLNLSGSFEKSVCNDLCYSDVISLIESTIEGNPLDLKRESVLEVSFQEGIIKRKLDVFINNQSGSLYKGYFRMFANADVGFSPVKIIFDDKKEVVEPEVRSARDMKEAGVFFEVKPNQSIILQFAWEGNILDIFNKQSEYQIKWIKQSGVEKYPLEIKIIFPEDSFISADKNFSLTDGGVFRYNSLLDQDITSRFFW